MKRILHLIGMMLIFGFVSTVVQADPIEDLSMKDYKAGWYPNFYQQQGPLTCPRTCEVWTGQKAEQEQASEMISIFKTTHVCKVTRDPEIIIEPRNDPKSHWLYGNQFDAEENCYVGTPFGTKESRYYMCLCVEACNKPDLIVSHIYDPVWDNTTGQSIIKVDITNIGAGMSANSVARLLDPGTGSVNFKGTPGLAAGATVTLVFTLNYWVFDPDAELEVMADYKNIIDECDETNNVKTYFKQG